MGRRIGGARWDRIWLQRVLACVAEQRTQSAQSIAEGIFAAARSFVNYEPQADDITSVVVKITG